MNKLYKRTGWMRGIKKLELPGLEQKITIKVTGFKKPLLFFLINMKEHFNNGGCVEVKFNNDGTIFEVRKLEIK